MGVTIDELMVGDAPESWAALGFAVDGDVCVVGNVRIGLTGTDSGKGLMGWSLRDFGGGELDGLSVTHSDRPPPAEVPEHPNGIIAIDHVVAISSDLARTVTALQATGLDLRRIREEPTPAGAPRQAFFRLGAVILEVVQAPEEAIERTGGDRPAFFWGPRLRRPRPRRNRRQPRGPCQRDPPRHPAWPPHSYPPPLRRPDRAGRADYTPNELRRSVAAWSFVYGLSRLQGPRGDRLPR